MVYLITFIEGIMTFISPCLLPMIPIYIGYLAGGKDKQVIFKNALGFVCGFTIMFSLLGLASGAIGTWLVKYDHLIQIVCGLAMVGFGLSFLGVFQLTLFKGFHLKTADKHQGFFSAVFFGLVFSLGWTPCVGAFLGSALMLAGSSGSIWMGLGLLVTYSLGLGVPFLLSALLLQELSQAFSWIKQHYDWINRIAGIFLVLMGILMMSGLFGQIIPSLT